MLSIFLVCIDSHWQELVTCIKGDLEIESIEWNFIFFFKKKLILTISNI